MRKKSLFETNRHLRDSEKYRTSLITNVSSSTAIETGEAIQTIAGRMIASTANTTRISRLKQKQSSR